MKSTTSGPVHDPARGGNQGFGGYPFGLEPLILPSAEIILGSAPGDGTAADPVGSYRETLSRIRTGTTPAGLVGWAESGDVPDEHFWFRWITGHQVCFVVWRLVGQLLDDVENGRRSPEEVLEPLCRYIDGYSVMLLYTGSCPRSIYSFLIRPSMRLRHRAFSGGWAPDYWPIRELFRGRQPAAIWHADTDALAKAVTLLRLVHDGVAARLVVDGKSLLRQASVRGPNRRLAGMIFDTYFMTVRAPIAPQEVVGQLLRRLVAIAQDVAANGLYSNEDNAARPAELRAPEVLACEDRFVDIMIDVAYWSCELGPAEMADPLQSTMRANAGHGVRP